MLLVDLRDDRGGGVTGGVPGTGLGASVMARREVSVDDDEVRDRAASSSVLSRSAWNLCTIGWLLTYSGSVAPRLSATSAARS